METNEEKSREFTQQELRTWYLLRTWFRKKLTPRTHEELEESGLGQKMAFLVQDKAGTLRYQLKHGEISSEIYERRMMEIRKEIGNCLYK